MAESTPFLNSTELSPDSGSLNFSKETWDSVGKSRGTAWHRFGKDTLLLLMTITALLLTAVIIYDRSASSKTGKGETVVFSLGTGGKLDSYKLDHPLVVIAECCSGSRH